MKKLLYSLFVGSVLLTSCDKNMTPGKTEVKTTTGSIELIPFNQSYIKDWNASDEKILSSWFYPSSEVSYSKTVSAKDLVIENHAWKGVDSAVLKVRLIAAKLTGQPIKIQRNTDPSKVDYVEVEFDQDDAAFDVWFRRNSITGEFDLYNSGTMKYKGETFQITTSSTTSCVLLFNYSGKTIHVNDIKRAKGVNDNTSNYTVPVQTQQKQNDLPKLKDQ